MLQAFVLLIALTPMLVGAGTAGFVGAGTAGDPAATAERPCIVAAGNANSSSPFAAERQEPAAPAVDRVPHRYRGPSDPMLFAPPVTLPASLPSVN